jgi:flagellar export protein FliJ
MKRFSFRLSRLLNVKHGLEQLEAKKLTEASETADQRLRAAEESNARKRAAEDQMTRVRQEPMAAGVMHVMERALRAVRGRAQADGRDYQSAIAEVETQRGRYLEARRERHALERLRDKQRRVWEQEVSSMEQKEMDGTASRIMQSKARSAP